MARAGLRIALVVLGLVAIVFGGLAVFTGAAWIAGGGEPVASVDSELRYYAAWYVLAGGLLMRAARGPEGETAVVRGVCAALVLGASGRVLSMLTVGAPHRTFVILTVVEYVIAVVLFTWHALVRRHS